jgi:cation/acetate symporter
MLIGLLVTLYYMVRVQFDSIPWLASRASAWSPGSGSSRLRRGCGASPPAFVTIIVVSLFGQPPSQGNAGFCRKRSLPEVDLVSRRSAMTPQ